MEFVFHECVKDATIAELTKENDTLVTKIRDERHLNLRMQKKLLELLSGKKLNVDLPDKSNPVLVEISCREISEDNVIYGERLVFSKKEMEHLKTLDGPENDRKYVKTIFEKCFTEAFFKSKWEEGCDTAATIKAIQSTVEYFIMNEMYQVRVIKNNTGDIQSRLKIFDAIVYKKTDYWFRHATKKPKTNEL